MCVCWEEARGVTQKAIGKGIYKIYQDIWFSILFLLHQCFKILKRKERIMTIFLYLCVCFNSYFYIVATNNRIFWTECHTCFFLFLLLFYLIFSTPLLSVNILITAKKVTSLILETFIFLISRKKNSYYLIIYQKFEKTKVNEKITIGLLRLNQNSILLPNKN